MDIEAQCEAIQCSILAKLIKEKIKTKHGLMSYCCIWVNTEKRNKVLVSLKVH